MNNSNDTIGNRTRDTPACNALPQPTRKAVCITSSECVFVSLVNQHAIRMRHIVLCELPRSILLFHIIS